jgi:hypothetical protein
MVETKRRQTADKQKVLAVQGFLNLALKDYLAARTLLNLDKSELALQGAISASTCVEKYFKAVIALRGNNTGKHLNTALVNSVKNYDPALYNSLNKSFLEFLQKCYQLRYFDTLPIGFSIGMTCREVLAELDFTVDKIQKKFKFEKNGVLLKIGYDSLLETHNPLLYENNYVLLGIDRAEFAEREVSAYAMILDKTSGLLEVFYRTKGSVTIDFSKPGLIPGTK